MTSLEGASTIAMENETRHWPWVTWVSIPMGNDHYSTLEVGRRLAEHIGENDYDSGCRRGFRDFVFMLESEFRARQIARKAKAFLKRERVNGVNIRVMAVA